MANKYPEIEKLGKKYRDQVGETAYNNRNVTVKDITKDYSDKFDTMQICFLSDTHIGSSDFDIKGLMENLQYADSQENAVVFILGDGINSAIVGSKSDAYEDLMNPQEELDTFAEVLKIAKGDRKLARVLKHLDDAGKIAVVHSGNHEDRITRAVGVSPTKVAADIAGVGEAFAPFYANTDIVLRQSLADDGKFHFGVVTHHGTGIRNIDGTFRLLRNVDNADMCVIGHTHQYSMKTDRTIRVDDQGEQYYHDVVCISPSVSSPSSSFLLTFWVGAGSSSLPYFSFKYFSKSAGIFRGFSVMLAITLSLAFFSTSSIVSIRSVILLSITSSLALYTLLTALVAWLTRFSLILVLRVLVGVKNA